MALKALEFHRPALHLFEIGHYSPSNNDTDLAYSDL